MNRSFVEQQNAVRLDYNPKPKRRNFLVALKKERATTGNLLILLFAVIVPFLIYYMCFDRNIHIQDDSYTCSVNKTYRIQCGLENVTRAEDCERIKCCFDNSTKLCFHTSPSRYNYDVGSPASPVIAKSPFGTEMKSVFVHFEEIDENRLKLSLKASDPGDFTPKNITKNYGIYQNTSAKLLSVQVFRNNGTQLLTTSKGPLIVSEKYWEWSFQLTTEFLYGFGESLMEISKEKPFNKVIYPHRLDHDSLPMFMAYHNKAFHGLTVRHDGPLELTVQSSGTVSAKSLAGDRLEFDLFVGPSPKDVFQQQTVKTKQSVPKVPTLSDFETHLCPGSDVTDINVILEEYSWAKSQFGIDFDSTCVHKNLFMSLLRNETVPDEIKQAVISNFVLNLPPQIPIGSALYNSTKTTAVFYHNWNDSEFVGKYLNMEVVYPDFEKETIDSYMRILHEKIEALLGKTIDRFALIDNWPREDSFNMTREHHPYMSTDLLQSMSETIEWNASDHVTRHNQYGDLQWRALSKYSTHTIMTASHTIDSPANVFVQEHETSWAALKAAMKKTIAASVFGNFQLGIPVCGSQAYYDTHYEVLCMRWFLFSVTSPVFRYTPWLPRQSIDRATFSQTALNTFKRALTLRRMLLPLYRTILYTEKPLLRPMFYNYHDDEATFGLDEQFMVGDDLLVAHPVLPGQSELSVYLPPSVGFWFEFEAGKAYNSRGNGSIVIDVIETDFTAFIKSGSVIPLINKLDQAQLTLKVALDCIQDQCESKGTLLYGSRIYSFVSNTNQTHIEYLKLNTSEHDEDLVLSKISLFRIDKVQHIRVTNSILANNVTIPHTTLD